MAIVDEAWEFAKTAVVYAPWLIVAAAGGFSYLRHRGPNKQRMHLLMQVAGAIGVYLLTLFELLVLDVIDHMGWYDKLWHSTHIICTFLIFVAAMIFAVGYTLEKIARPTALATV